MTAIFVYKIEFVMKDKKKQRLILIYQYLTLYLRFKPIVYERKRGIIALCVETKTV